MSFVPEKVLRVCEWSSVDTLGLNSDQRQALNAAAAVWAQEQRLATPPLSFGGPSGQLLNTAQYVGVIEIDDVAIEIYPKLDVGIVASGKAGTTADQSPLASVMRNLIWMLEIAEHRELVEAETGHLEEAPTTFIDLFAFLLGKHLLNQLVNGVSHHYVAWTGNLSTVRGRIRLGDQVLRNWNRFDRIACTWDEFTPNTPVNRLFKCACRFLSDRVSYNKAARLLVDCLAMLDDADDVGPMTALREVQDLRFDRSMERFRLTFDLAKRLLMASGHAMGAGGANTYVFLIDMNQLFERYVHAALEARFETSVKEQEHVGYLLNVVKGRIRQKTDYVWQYGGHCWIGDAKYKHLAEGQSSALRFADLPDTDEEQGQQAILAGHLLSPDDVRQLTVYAELAKGKSSPKPNVKLALGQSAASDHNQMPGS